MVRLFISYSRKDIDFSRRLATSLAESGADVWVDVEDIAAGVSWSSSIQEGLDTADLMLLVVTPDSMASENVTDEWAHFRRLNRTIIPLLLKPSNVPYQLERFQFIDFHQQPYDVAFQKLRDELSKKGLPLGIARPSTARTMPSATRPSSAIPTNSASRAPTKPAITQPTSATPTTAPKPNLNSRVTLALFLLLALIVVAFNVLPRISSLTSGSRLTPTPGMAIRNPASGSEIGQETLCIDGIGSKAGDVVTVQVLNAGQAVVDHSQTTVNDNLRWKTWVTVPAQTPSDGSILAFTADESGAMLQQATIAIKLIDHYLPAAPFLGTRPDDLCQDNDTDPLSQ